MLSKIIMCSIMFVFIALGLGMPVGLFLSSLGLSETAVSCVWFGVAAVVTYVCSIYAFKESA